MTSSASARPTKALAELIARQLGTDAVILITPGKFACVVVAPAPSQTVPAAAESPGSTSQSALSGHGERLAYSVAEAAKALGLSRDIIYQELRAGRLGSLKVGRRRIITREQIDEFLARLSQR